LIEDLIDTTVFLNRQRLKHHFARELLCRSFIAAAFIDTGYSPGCV
jgi:hypothetical protein